MADDKLEVLRKALENSQKSPWKRYGDAQVEKASNTPEAREIVRQVMYPDGAERYAQAGDVKLPTKKQQQARNRAKARKK